ncbi:MAG: hypothetical protein ABS81_09485 [Pseudonocardia sp. SCN 72-86]|nr:MAG: hypothetical protein ABS81_09485 [Pseudonocardia sp. SCN 72-86]
MLPADDVGLLGVPRDALESWLRGTGCVEPPFVVRRIGNGQSNITCVATGADGRRVVLRRPPHGARPGSGHDVARESRVIAALAGSSVRVPRVFGALDHDGAAPVVAMSCVDGQPLDRAGVAALGPQARRRAGLSLAQTLAAVHDVDIDAVGLGTLASRAPYGPRQISRWTRQWEATRTRELPVLDELAGRLRRSTPPQRETRLVHGDLHPGNVLVDPVDGSVVAALDWELCTLGEPVADLGTLLAYWPEPGEPSPVGVAVSTADGFPTRAELVAEYATASGRDVSDVGFWHALGLWKLAIICEGIVRRATSDARNRAEGWTPARETVDEVAEGAFVVARAAGL